MLSLLSSTLQGFNATVFAYGQTSSGKTYTVRGDEKDPGLIPLSIQNIFKLVSEIKDRKFKISVSFLELYNEQINDLLISGNENLEVRENLNGTYIKQLSENIVTTPEEAMKLLFSGDQLKKVAETKLNDQSSRSHTVFRISVESKLIEGSAGDSIRISQLNLVDLAGSEGVSRTGAEGIRLK